MGVEDGLGQFFNHFDSSQGGNTSGGEGFSQGPEISDEVQRGITMINNIDSIDPRSLSEAEFAISRYYKFSIWVTLFGIDPREAFQFTPKLRNAHDHVVDIGARLTAHEHLGDDPDNFAAMAILTDGIDAPLGAHRDFFSVVDANARRFILDHNWSLD